MRMLKRRFPFLGLFAFLSISGLIRGCVIQAQLRRPLKFLCEGAEQLLYMANYNLLKNKNF